MEPNNLEAAATQPHAGSRGYAGKVLFVGDTYTIPIQCIPFQAAATAAGGRRSCDAFHRAHSAAASARDVAGVLLAAVSGQARNAGTANPTDAAPTTNHSNSKPWLRVYLYIASVRMVYFKPEWSCAPSCSKFWVKSKTLPAFGWQTMSSPSPVPPRTNVVDPPCDRGTSWR